MVNYYVRKYPYIKTCRCAYVPLQEPEGSQRQLLISFLCGNGRDGFIEKYSFKEKASIIEQKTMISCFCMGKRLSENNDLFRTIALYLLFLLGLILK